MSDIKLYEHGQIATDDSLRIQYQDEVPRGREN